MEKKKRYERPMVRVVKMQEVAAATCCRATLGACSALVRNSSGKGQRTVTAS